MFDSLRLLSTIRGFYRDLYLKYTYGFGSSVGPSLTRCNECNFSCISSAERTKQCFAFVYLFDFKSWQTITEYLLCKGKEGYSYKEKLITFVLAIVSWKFTTCASEGDAGVFCFSNCTFDMNGVGHPSGRIPKVVDFSDLLGWALQTAHLHSQSFRN